MKLTSDGSVVARHANTRYVFRFSEGGRGDVAVLGGKGAGLAHMTRLRLPVPPGFVVSTRAGREFLDNGTIPGAARAEIDDHVAHLEAEMGRRLGDPALPLLVSVRSGAPVSMPGMMDTVLNVGLNSDTLRGLAEETGDERFAWRCYERLVETYARVVRGVDPGELEDRLMDLGDAAASAEVVEALLDLVAEHDGRPVPDDPREQVLEAIAAVFGSWDSPRAKAYRRFRGIDDGLATAATVQAMVFGNRGETSASGVAFTRDPSTGEIGAFGDVLFNAQGEDVVAGERDAEPLDAMAQRLPEAYVSLKSTLRTIEADAGDLCEVEFTVEERNLWILQTRIGLRSGPAAVRVAVALVDEERISVQDAISRITPAQLEAAGAPRLPTAFPAHDTIARGLAASPGAAIGEAVFDPARATKLAAQGHDVVLLRPTTSPGDVAGFVAARAVVTGRGGRTSHAAVVARGMQRPAVCGVGEIRVSQDGRSAELAGVTLREGDLVTVDGDRGLLARGRHELGPAVADPAVNRFLTWCADRARVPALAPQDVAALAWVHSLDALSSHADRVVLSVENAATTPAAELAKSLRARDAPAPVLAPGAAWLRAADAPLRGRVSGIIVTGLLMDYGGVLTNALRPVMETFCRSKGLPDDALAALQRPDSEFRTELEAYERGEYTDADFLPRFAAALGLLPHDMDSFLADVRPDDRMMRAVAALRSHGIPVGLLSNSWNMDVYPRELLAGAFDVVVISGEVGMRKPEPRIYFHAAQALGVDARCCVFVDDTKRHVVAAAEVGMTVIHHQDATQTLRALERLFHVNLAST